MITLVHQPVICFIVLEVKVHNTCSSKAKPEFNSNNWPSFGKSMLSRILTEKATFTSIYMDRIIGLLVQLYASDLVKLRVS